MSQTSGRDWTKERWRKQYVREPLQHRAWPVMARGLRELLNALAEDDGSLVRDVGDPVEALLRGLNPQEYEVELVQAAIALLLQDGFLDQDEHSIWIPDLPRSQALREAAPPAAERTPTSVAPPQTSTERVRQFRERQRNAAPVSEPVSSTPGPAVPAVSGAVSLRVSFADQQDPFLGLDSEKDRAKDHPPQKRAGANPGVSPSVSVASVSSPSVSETEGEEEFTNVPRDLKEALALPAAGRAALLRRRPELGGKLAPDRWPEVAAIAAAFAEGAGLPKLYLGAYEKDEGVRRVVELLAIGFPQSGLEYVARTVPKQPWWTAGGKRLGLSSLSPEVVRRNMPSEDGRPRIMSPRVAKVIEAAEQERKAHGANVATRLATLRRTRSTRTSALSTSATLIGSADSLTESSRPTCSSCTRWQQAIRRCRQEPSGSQPRRSRSLATSPAGRSTASSAQRLVSSPRPCSLTPRVGSAPMSHPFVLSPRPTGR